MGWTLLVYWPGSTLKEQRSLPGFRNDDAGWADFMAAVDDSPEARASIEDLGVSALLAAVFEDMDDEAKADACVSPQDYAAAAGDLQALVSSRDPRAAALVELYSQGGDAELATKQLAEDLEDLGAIAAYAIEGGANSMALQPSF